MVEDACTMIPVMAPKHVRRPSLVDWNSETMYILRCTCTLGRFHNFLYNLKRLLLTQYEPNHFTSASVVVLGDHQDDRQRRLAALGSLSKLGTDPVTAGNDQVGHYRT